MAGDSLLAELDELEAFMQNRGVGGGGSTATTTSGKAAGGDIVVLWCSFFFVCVAKGKSRSRISRECAVCVAMPTFLNHG